MRNRHLGNSNQNYGETLFKILFILFLSLGTITVFLTVILTEYLSLLLTIGINTVLFSFVFKFMESVIILLLDIKRELKNHCKHLKSTQKGS